MAKTTWTLVQFPNLSDSVDRETRDAIQLLFNGLKDHADAFTALKSQLDAATTTVAVKSTGVAGVTAGGTGTQSLPSSGVLLGQGASAIQAAIPGAVNGVLTSNGTGVNPSFHAPVHSEPLTDGNSNFIFAAGDVIVTTGVPD